MKKKYDIVYSIGRDCGCSEYLIRANLRSCSGPFDWISGPKFKDRIDFIENDFKDFLNIEDLEKMEKNLNANIVDLKNDYYMNKRTKSNDISKEKINNIEKLKKTYKNFSINYIDANIEIFKNFPDILF